MYQVQRFDSTLRRKLNLISPTRLTLLLMKLRKYHVFQHEGSAQFALSCADLISYVPQLCYRAISDCMICQPI